MKGNILHEIWAECNGLVVNRVGFQDVHRSRMASPASGSRRIRDLEETEDILARVYHGQGHGVHFWENSLYSSIRCRDQAAVIPSRPTRSARIVSSASFSKQYTLTRHSLYAGAVEFAVIVGDVHIQLFSAAAQRGSQKAHAESAKAFATRLIQVNSDLKQVRRAVQYAGMTGSNSYSRS